MIRQAALKSCKCDEWLNDSLPNPRLAFDGTNHIWFWKILFLLKVPLSTLE